MKRAVFLLIFLTVICCPIWANVSDKQISEISNQMEADITKAYGKPEELAPDSRLSRIFSNLVQQAHRKGINYRLKVSESNDINAYAMPDGRIVFLSGLIKALPADDDSPLAWVAAHEISHIEMKHAEKKLMNSLASGAILFLLVGRSSTAMQALGVISQGLLTSGYSRVKEYEADRGALELMRKAGYDTNGAIVTLRLFQDMEKKRKSPRIFPSHPRSGDRYGSVIAWMQSNGVAIRDYQGGGVKTAQNQSQEPSKQVGAGDAQQTGPSTGTTAPTAGAPSRPAGSAAQPARAAAQPVREPLPPAFIDMTLERPQPMTLP
jgi:predicted Zn-dependent protease